VKVSDRIKAIRNMGSRSVKLEVFRQAMREDEVETDGLFAKVVRYAMDPTITFNVGVISVQDGLRNAGVLAQENLSHADIEFLDKLATRKIGRTEGSAWANNRIKHLCADEAEVLVGVLDKDLSWGLGASSINSVVPDFLMEFHCMLASKFDAAAIRYPCYIEPKYDGMRILAFCDDNGATFFSRTGKPVTSLPERMVTELVTIKRSSGFSQIVFDGEVMGESFKETMEKARRKVGTFENAVFHVFDAIPADDFKKVGKVAYQLAYRDRRNSLARAIKGNSFSHIKLPESYIVSSEEEVTHYYNAFRDAGLEGAIVKISNGGYVGRRSPLWMKMKAEESEDLEIVGFEEGEGKYVGMLGALIVNRDGVDVRVGTGLTDDDRLSIWSNRSLYLRKMVEVQFQEVTPDGSLRHPRFIRMRMDKSEW
jgi:DNA ligase 1